MEEQEIIKIKTAVIQAISPIKPVDDHTRAEPKFLFNAERSKSSKGLPPYYLIYFLLVDLLKYKNLGQFEKIAWSVPIDYLGEAYLIEYRKFGVGVFATDIANKEETARKIVELICRGVRIAEPYYEYIASKAVSESKINVNNVSAELFERFVYFITEYKQKLSDADRRKGETITEPLRYGGFSIHYPEHELRKESYWLAIAAIDAFFSWTEHIFILIGLLLGKISTGNEVAKLADTDWPNKYKLTIGLIDPKAKYYYEKFLEIRRQFRNIITHGAFGKDGEAFYFHSGTGAVPVFLPHKARKQPYSISERLTFNDREIIRIIEEFILYIWSGELAPAKIYIESTYPIILPMVSDGAYGKAMESEDDMEELLKGLGYMFDQAANMDW